MSSSDGLVWKPKINPDLKMQIMDDEAILLDKTNERVHQLNEIAAFILHRCDGIRSESDIVATVVKRYDVSEDTARADGLELLERMKVLAILV